MAKTKDMAKSKEKNKMNPFIKILFMIVLPLLVAGTLAIFVLSFVGIDVIGWSKEKLQNVPVVSSIIKTDEEKDLERKLQTANETISSQREEIDNLKQEVENLQSQLEDYELEITKIENEQQTEEALASESSDEVNISEEIKQVANSFQKMDKEQAAKIVENLDTSTAVELLSSLSAKVRGEIFEQMDPQAAARIMETMAND